MEDHQYQDSEDSDTPQSVSYSSDDSEYLENIIAHDREHFDTISRIICRGDCKGLSALMLRKAVQIGNLKWSISFFDTARTP